MPVYKSQSKRVAFQSLSLSGAANTSLVPLVQVSKDGGVFVSSSNNPSHLGQGCWSVTLTDTEMNGDLIVIIATANNCVPAQREIYTEADWSATRASRVDHLDAAISTRSVYPGTDTPGTSTLLNRISTQRASNLDNLDTSVSSRLPASSYAAPSSPTAIAAAILANPGSKLATDFDGRVSLNLAQAVPTSNSPQSIGDALNAARAQGFGKWSLDLDAKTLALYAADGVTIVRTFLLDSATSPTTRS